MSLKDELLSEIDSAFEGVALDGGVSLDQSKVIDSYGEGVTEEEFNKIPKKEVTNDWRKIPFYILDEADCIAHLDAKGFKYYIPALMKRLVENYDPSSMMSIGTLSVLYPKKANYNYSSERYSLLSKKQCVAIAHYLKELPNLVCLEAEDLKCVQRAFNNHWSKYV